MINDRSIHIKLLNVLPVAARLGGAGLQFFIFSVIVVTLPVTEGAYVLSFQLWCNLAAAVGQFGLSIVSLRISRYLSTQKRIAYVNTASVLIILLTTSLMAGCIAEFGFFLALKHQGMREIGIQPFLFVAGLSISQVSADLFRGLKRNVISSIATSLYPFISFALIVVFYFLGYKDANAYIWCLVIGSSCAGCVVIAINIIGILNFLNISREKKRIFLFLRTNLYFSFRSFKTSVVSFAGLQADQLVLSVVANPHDFGSYITAARVAQIINVVVSSINPVVATQIFSMEKNNRHLEARRLFARCNFYLTILAILILLFLFSSKYWLSNEQIFGGRLHVSALVLCLCLAPLLNLSTGPKGYYLWMAGHDSLVQRLMLWAGVLSGLVSTSYLITQSILATAVGVGVVMVIECGFEIYLMIKIGKFWPFEMYSWRNEGK